MILNAVTFLVLVLLALYMASQGMLTAILLLVSALFASVLALGLYEPLSGMIPALPTEYGAGVVFLGVFLVAFALIRIGSDFAVPKNLKLPSLLNRVAGGAVGLLAGMVIVGTTVVGLELLPLGDSIGGTTSVANAMKSINESATERPAKEEVDRTLSKTRLTWARMVTGIYYLASGHSLGGTPLETVHPDFGVEMLGYRHTVQAGGRMALASSLVDVDSWYKLLPEEAKAQGLDIASSGTKPLLIIRTRVEKGDDKLGSAEKTDKQDVLMLSPTQVRLVMSNDRGLRQYYPIGMLYQGRNFQPLPIGSGYTIDDYAVSGDKTVATYDWVFEVDDGTPQFIEIKRGGRVSLADKEPKKTFAPLAMKAYPPHDWDKNAAELRVTVKIGGKAPSQAMVLRILPTGMKNKVNSLISTVDRDYGNEARGYDNTLIIQMKNAAPTEAIQLDNLLRLAALGKQKGTSLASAYSFLTGEMVDTLQDAGVLKDKAAVDGTGSTPAMKVASGTYVLVVVARNDDVVRLWTRSLIWEPKGGGGNNQLEETFDQEATVEIKR